MKFVVELYDIVIGYLEGLDVCSFDFVGVREVIEVFGMNSCVLFVVIFFVCVFLCYLVGRRWNWFGELFFEGD